MSVPPPLAGHELFHSSDLDETREHVARIFCDHRLSLGRGERRINARQHAARVGGLTLSYLDYGGAVDIVPGPLETFYLVQIPLHGEALIRCGRNEIVSTPGLASVPDPTAHLSMEWRPQCPHVIVKLERPALETRLRELTDRPLTEALRFELGFDLTRGAGRRFLAAIELALAELEAADSATNAGLGVGPLEDLLTGMLLFGLPSNYSATLHAPVAPPGPRHVRRAVEFIESHLDDPITVGAIAAAAGVSVRSLQEGFRRTLGVTPTAHVRNLRLDRARADILAGDLSVTDAAVRWGFTHLGRFARLYRGRFGELPRETRRHGGGTAPR